MMSYAEMYARYEQLSAKGNAITPDEAEEHEALFIQLFSQPADEDRHTAALSGRVSDDPGSWDEPAFCRNQAS